MSLKKIGGGRRLWEWKIGGGTWRIVFMLSQKNSPYRVYDPDGRYYPMSWGRLKTLKAAKEFLCNRWLGGRLVLMYELVTSQLTGDVRAEFDEMRLAPLPVFIDWLNDHDLFHYVKPIIQTGNQAKVIWPGEWAEVAKNLKGVCR